MSRVRSSKGVKALQGQAVIIKTSGKSVRQLQCPKCHQNAAPSLNARGQTVYKCPRGHLFGGAQTM